MFIRLRTECEGERGFPRNAEIMPRGCPRQADSRKTSTIADMSFPECDLPLKTLRFRHVSETLLDEF